MNKERTDNKVRNNANQIPKSKINFKNRGVANQNQNGKSQQIIHPNDSGAYKSMSNPCQGNPYGDNVISSQEDSLERVNQNQ